MKLSDPTPEKAGRNGLSVGQLIALREDLKKEGFLFKDIDRVKIIEIYDNTSMGPMAYSEHWREWDIKTKKFKLDQSASAATPAGAWKLGGPFEGVQTYNLYMDGMHAKGTHRHIHRSTGYFPNREKEIYYIIKIIKRLIREMIREEKKRSWHEC